MRPGAATPNADYQWPTGYGMPCASTPGPNLEVIPTGQADFTRETESVDGVSIDGAQQWQLADSQGVGTIDSSNQLRFFRDNESGGTTTEHAQGAVARIRVFDRALSATEVRDLGQLPSTLCAT